MRQYGHTATPITNDIVLYFGGLKEGLVPNRYIKEQYIYNYKTRTNTSKVNMNRAMFSHGTLYWRESSKSYNTIMHCGGEQYPVPNSHYGSAVGGEAITASEPYKDCFIYDYNSNTIAMTTALSENLYEFAYASTTEYKILFGGKTIAWRYTGEDSFGRPTYAPIYGTKTNSTKWNPSSKTWSDLALSVHSGADIVHGAEIDSEEIFQIIYKNKKNQILNFPLNTATLKKNVPYVTNGVRVSKLKNKFSLVSGVDNGQKITLYDLSTDTWKAKARLPYTVTEHSVVKDKIKVNEDIFYLSGGKDGSTIYSSQIEFNYTKNTMKRS